MEKVKILYKKIDELVPYANNPRHNDGAVDAVAESIKEFGFKVPIIIDEDGEIIAGHTRLKASKKLGMEEVPCIVASDLTPEQVKAFRLADNKVGELATWDFELLESELEAIESFDMVDFGFDESEIKENFEDDNFNLEEELEEAAEKEPITKRGDIYKLGEHFLICGDATNGDDIKKIANPDGVDLVVTDPPYNVDYVGKTKDKLKIKNDSFEDEEFFTFLEKAFENIKHFLKPGGAYYIWKADSKKSVFSEVLKKVGIEEKQNLIWVKNCLVLGRQDYHWKHEPCLYGWKEGAAHYFIDEFTNTTVYDDAPNLARMSKEELKDYVKTLLSVIEDRTTILREDKPSSSRLHPTMKPVPLIAKQIKNSSRKGEIVLDIFGGSGTTLIACEQTGRKARLVELDPVYCDVIVKRWEEFTGEKAVKINE